MRPAEFAAPRRVRPSRPRVPARPTGRPTHSTRRRTEPRAARRALRQFVRASSTMGSTVLVRCERELSAKSQRDRQASRLTIRRPPEGAGSARPPWRTRCHARGRLRAWQVAPIPGSSAASEWEAAKEERPCATVVRNGPLATYQMGEVEMAPGDTTRMATRSSCGSGIAARRQEAIWPARTAHSPPAPRATTSGAIDLERSRARAERSTPRIRALWSPSETPFAPSPFVA